MSSVQEGKLAPSILEVTNLLSTLNEKTFFSELSKAVKVLTGEDHVLIYEAFEDGSSKLVVEDGKVANKEIRFEKGYGLSGYVIRTKRAYYSNNVKRDPLLSAIEYEESIQSELCVPIECGGTVFATVHIQSCNPERTFSNEDVQVILNFLDKVERPISNMKMYLTAKHLNEALMKKIQEKEQELERKNNRTRNYVRKIEAKDMIGKSEPFIKMLNFLEKVAASDSNILIEGQSGTGKELVAQRVHLNSKRRDNPYIVVNCGAIPENLIESELFGHEKGAFTGAVSEKQGLVELANGGTLFLDEVGELSLTMQTKLLRFLQEGEAYRVGKNTPYTVDVRVISATNRDLKKEVEEGKLREDLFYRLNTIKIEVPSLKERKDDVKLLAEYFLNFKKDATEHKTLTASAINRLMSYPWPGNIRELQNAMERAYILSDGRFIDESHLPDCVLQTQEEEEQEERWQEMTLELLEKKHIIRTLEHLGGNKTKTAKTLGITVKTLYNKLHSYGMIQSRESNQ